MWERKRSRGRIKSPAGGRIQTHNPSIMRRVLDHRAESKFLFQKSEKDSVWSEKNRMCHFFGWKCDFIVDSSFHFSFFRSPGTHRSGLEPEPSSAYRWMFNRRKGGGTVGRGRLDDQGKPLVKIFSIWNLFLFTISDHFVACNWVFYVWSEAGPQVVECWSMDISKLGSSPTVGPEQSTFQHV